MAEGKWASGVAVAAGIVALVAAAAVVETVYMVVEAPLKNLT